MRIKNVLKSALLSSAIGERLYAAAQETWFNARYRRTREKYQEALVDDPDAWSCSAAISRARKRIKDRGYRPAPRRVGDVHTYAYIPGNWSHQNQIAKNLTKLGFCTRFDYTKHGVALSDLRSANSMSSLNRQELQKQLLDHIKETHRRRPIDWFFSYALGWDLTAESLRRIHEEMGIPTVNISLDDKNWWWEIERGDRISGLSNIAPKFDLAWTSATTSVPWYWAEGGQAIFLPEGVDTDWFRPIDGVSQDIGVGFVGSDFGRRRKLFSELRKAGITVAVFGDGWEGGRLDDESMLRFFNRCEINLGIGDMHHSRWLTNLKGRDFEIPSVGCGVYVTTYNSDLAQCFALGREIICYRGIDELIELIRYYIRNREEAKAIAERGRLRCIADHKWTQRFLTILNAIEVVADNTLGINVGKYSRE
jgi:hypothetical protein